MLKATFADADIPIDAVQDAWHVPPAATLAGGAPLAGTYAWEERRFAAMRAGLAGPLAYVWVPHDSLSIGRAEARRIGLGDLDYRAEPVAVRATGGTAVPQGAGTANITLFTRHREAPGIRPFYEALCAALAEGFDALGLHTTVGAREGSFCDGDYNLLLDGEKLVGTAQRWGRARDGSTVGQHHCVVMCGGDARALCARVDALYKAAGLPDRAAPSAHASPELSIAQLRDALTGPLDRLVAARP